MKTLTRIEVEIASKKAVFLTFCLGGNSKWTALFPNDVWSALRKEIHMSVEVIEL